MKKYYDSLINHYLECDIKFFKKEIKKLTKIQLVKFIEYTRIWCRHHEDEILKTIKRALQ